MSLRWRLTLFYALITTVILLIAGSVLLLSLRATLRQSLDDALTQSANLAASQMAGDETASSATHPNQSSHPDKPEPLPLVSKLPVTTVILIYNAGKQQIDHLGEALTNAPLEPGFVTLDDVRVFTEKLPDGGWVQVQRSKIETLEALNRTQRLLLLGLPVLLLLGLALGYVLADRALRPVDRVTSLAQRITQLGKFKERLPTLEGRDEMARLTQTFNAMLERLESTLERERAFALSAAHELQTPLSILQARASLSLEQPRSPEQYQNSLELIRQTSQELSQVVETLLILARSSQPAPSEPLELDMLALEVAESWEVLAHGRGMRIHLELQEVQVLGSSAALRLLISNLLNNAIKYGKTGGQIWLRTGSNLGKPWLEVCDDGLGIMDSDLEQMIQPFQRGLGMQHITGTGLGLALVKAVAEQHGGILTLSRALEGGLRVNLELGK